ncbi:hypothetical protein ACMD2_07718 [Ananas comosus]|uniref:Uncharacterized protein n=1 Tax=Ananas comosus TaxID=4615 RepID=A0A199UZ84_ANACO|nr:hypothetical protein ACMD2_07718 [Ananas comosus]
MATSKSVNPRLSTKKNVRRAATMHADPISRRAYPARVCTAAALLGIVGARVGLAEHGAAQAVGAPTVEAVGALGVLDDADDEHEDGGDDKRVALEGAEEDGGGREELEEEADEVAAPELVVLNREGGDGVGAAEVEEEEGGPEGEDDGAAGVVTAAAAAAAAASAARGGGGVGGDGGGGGADVAEGVEEEAEAEVGDPVGEEVAGPDDEAGEAGGRAAAERGDEDEEDLEDQAGQDRRPDFPVGVLLRNQRLEPHTSNYIYVQACSS